MPRIGRGMRLIGGFTGQLACKSMIDVTVMRFIGAHDQHNIPQCRIGG